MSEPLITLKTLINYDIKISEISRISELSGSDNMEERKAKILSIIIQEHIKTGAPVGSGVLVDKYKLEISPATVRNEMSELEESGFIMQPYTSAGRVPTEKAYKYYIESLKDKKIEENLLKELSKILKKKDELALKQVAKKIAQASDNAIIWAFHRRNLYYTGISNLLQQPEFAESNLIYNISSIIDRLDEIVNEVFDNIAYEPEILIGAENPFSNLCSSVLFRYKLENKIGMVAILGPMRMDYEKNMGLMRFIHEKLNLR